MKLCVVALDYDDTIARDGRADPLVLEAGKEAQTRGIRAEWSGLRLVSRNVAVSSICPDLVGAGVVAASIRSSETKAGVADLRVSVFSESLDGYLGGKSELS